MLANISDSLILIFIIVICFIMFGIVMYFNRY